MAKNTYTKRVGKLTYTLYIDCRICGCKMKGTILDEVIGICPDCGYDIDAIRDIFERQHHYVDPYKK